VLKKKGTSALWESTSVISMLITLGLTRFNLDPWLLHIEKALRDIMKPTPCFPDLELSSSG